MDKHFTLLRPRGDSQHTLAWIRQAVLRPKQPFTSSLPSRIDQKSLKDADRKAHRMLVFDRTELGNMAFQQVVVLL